jgi:type I restriction enzyme M protein
MIEQDLVECVIGLGPNLFYNSPMEACLLITKTNKSESRKGNILIVNAVKEVKQEKNIAFLENEHIAKIFKSYLDFKDDKGFCKVVSNEEVLGNRGSLNIAQYVSNVDDSIKKLSIYEALINWEESSIQVNKSMNELFQILN